MTPGDPARRPHRVLFVCHEGQRTGAPLLLLWLLRWLTSHTTLEPVVALMRDGPLQQEFSALCPTHTFTPPPLSERWHRRLQRRLAPAASQDPAGWLAALVNRLQPDCLYLNTLVLGYALGGLRFEPGTAPAVISHGHEMELGLMLSSQPELVKRQLALSHHVIGCAEAVREHLSERYGLQPAACTVIPEYIPYRTPAELQGLRCTDASQAVIDRLQHWRQQGVFLFGFAGSPIDRKGFDLFPQLVKACVRRFGTTPFKAVWVGCAEGSRAHTQARRDLRLLGVEEQALLLSGVSCGAAALAELQALALLSREDPYPVVALEAGALAVPTVCFRGSGGIATLVEQKGVGLAVDYLDLDAFAAALHRLQQEPALAQQLGQAMQTAVFSGHTLEQAGAAIAERIEAEIAHQARRG